MNYLLPERLDRLAREYALGTLAGPARRRFEKVIRMSAAAAAAVDAWRSRLSVLELASAPLQPPVNNWAGIERRLFPRAAPSVAPVSSIVARPTASSGGSTGGWLRGLFGGRLFGTLASGALAGVLGCFLVLRADPGVAGLESGQGEVPASYLGLLVDHTNRPALVASSRKDGTLLTLRLLQPLDIPPGRVAQLWALPTDGTPPFAMAVLPSQGSVRLEMRGTSEALLAHAADLGVSYDTAPAKPGDLPTRPFELSGHCVKVW